MNFSEAIKKLRQQLLLSQEGFGREIGVTFATVNRWEMGKTQPNYKALRQIEELCKRHNFDFEEIRRTTVGSGAVAPIDGVEYTGRAEVHGKQCAAHGE